MARNKNVEQELAEQDETGNGLSEALQLAHQKRRENSERRSKLSDSDRDTEDINVALRGVIDRLVNGRNDFATVARRTLVHKVKRRDEKDETGAVVSVGKIETMGTVTPQRLLKAFAMIEDAVKLARARVFNEQADEEQALI